MFCFTDRTASGQAHVAFTQRYRRGASGPELDLALGADSADLRTVVAEFVAESAPPAVSLADSSAQPGSVGIASMYQVHGANVIEVGPIDAGEMVTASPHADGIVTRALDVVLVVRTADCVPVLLADADARVVGAVHAGRPGVAAGVVLNAVATMRALGASGISAWVGPHVCGRCYEVPQSLQDEVVALEPATSATTSWGTPALDIGAGVIAQLERVGVTAPQVIRVQRCTREDNALPSYRRDGAAAGRLVGLIRRTA